MSSSSSSSSSPPSLDPAAINELVDEIDDNSFYHHPSWPQRWSHPDFTGYFLNNWTKAPWSKQQRRRTTRFLIPSMHSKFPWGYMIYRTVYTAESDELWPIAMEKLTQIMDYSIESDLYAEIRHKKPEDPEPDPTAERLVKESRKDVIFSDKKFWDGAGIEQVRQHFADYLRASKGRGYGRFEGCLIIDERSLKSIVASPVFRRGEAPQRHGQPYGFVGMIDGRYPETRYEPKYTGFMRVELPCLWPLYAELTSKYMWELCPSVPEDLIPVYDGGTGKAHDEEGNVHRIATDRGVRLF
ncbi:hypothetical protein CNMCM6106_007190 [Aspergillus hiratsukae]|nr:hypothetical protein CNMCM6106_007190 [Aspergillus hiratsukae]